MNKKCPLSSPESPHYHEAPLSPGCHWIILMNKKCHLIRRNHHIWVIGPGQAWPSQNFGFWSSLWYYKARAAQSQAKARAFRPSRSQHITTRSTFPVLSLIMPLIRLVFVYARICQIQLIICALIILCNPFLNYNRSFLLTWSRNMSLWLPFKNKS